MSDFVASPSRLDASVNFVRALEVGLIEARYVRRRDDYFVVYLSTQTGCQQACRMCHLTASGQMRLRDVTYDEILEQADVVLEHYRSETAARSVHYNFMARGEPLASAVMLERSGDLFDALWRRAKAIGVRSRFLVSTILPEELGERALEDVFDRYHPEIYYSLYSTNDAFRRRWLPRALPVNEALARLAAWQRSTYKIVKIHHAFIEGENDAEADVHAVCDAIDSHGLYVHVNIVRYNAWDEARGRESSEGVLHRNARILSERLPRARVRVIPRVGFDVHASCGMFVG